MKKNKTTSMDGDHEIEEFLQKYIVEKIIDGYEINTNEIIKIVSELQEKINSIKNSNNTTNQDISLLIQNNNTVMGDITDIIESVGKITKKIETAKTDIKKSIVSEDRMSELVSSEMTKLLQDSISIYRDELRKCNDKLVELLALTGDFTKDMKALQVADDKIQASCVELTEMLKNVIKQLSINNDSMSEILQLSKQNNANIGDSKEELIQNNKMIIEAVNGLNQKAKFLWITVGVDTVIILGLLIAVFCR